MKKTIEYYMDLPYRMEIIPDEEGYTALFPDLPGCITCAKTASGVLENAIDAKKAWLTAAMEDGVEIPEPKTADAYSGQFKLRIPRDLHRRLAEQSKVEGISMNQYCMYLLASGVAYRQA